MNINLHHQLQYYDHDPFVATPAHYLRISVIFNSSWGVSSYGKMLLYDQFEMKLFKTIDNRSACFVDNGTRCDVFIN